MEDNKKITAINLNPSNNFIVLNSGVISDSKKNDYINNSHFIGITKEQMDSLKSGKGKVLIETDDGKLLRNDIKYPLYIDLDLIEAELLEDKSNEMYDVYKFNKELLKEHYGIIAAKDTKLFMCKKGE